MRVHILYGDSLSDLSRPMCTFTHTRAVEIVRNAIKTGHARYNFYVIQAAPVRPLDAKAKAGLATLHTKNSV